MTKNIATLPIPAPGTRFLQQEFVNGTKVNQRLIVFEGLDADHYLRFSIPGKDREHINIAPHGWLAEKEWEARDTRLKTVYTEMKPKHTEKSVAA